MKKLLLFGWLLTLITASFVSCDKDNTLSADEQLIEEIMNSNQKLLITEDELPLEVSDYVTLHYAPVLVEEAYHVNGKGFEIWLENGVNVYFGERKRNCLGDREHPHPRVRCLRGDQIEIAELPQEIIDYVTTTFPDETIEIAVVKPFGAYAVGLSNHMILIFDEEGSFISRCGRWDRPGHPGRRCMLGMEIEAAELPQDALDYISDQYPDETIEKAVTKPSGIFAVLLSSHDILLFDAEGAFIRKCRG